MKTFLNIDINLLKTRFAELLTAGHGETSQPQEPESNVVYTNARDVEKMYPTSSKSSITSNQSSTHYKVSVDGMPTQSGYSVGQEAFRFSVPIVTTPKPEEKMSEEKKLGVGKINSYGKFIEVTCPNCTEVYGNGPYAGKYFKCSCGCYFDMFSGQIKCEIHPEQTVDEHYICFVCAAEESDENSNLGKKYDEAKPAMALLSPKGLEEEAKAMTYGAKKYGAYNWRKGISASRYLSAALRHITAILNGQLLDDESGLSHLGHAKANLGMLIQTLEDHPELNDLYVKETK